MQSALALVKQFHEFASAGQFDRALELFASDARLTFHGPSSLPMAGTYVGQSGLRDFFVRVGQSLEVLSFEAREFIDAESAVTVLGRERSRVRATGANLIASGRKSGGHAMAS